jgi:hypothetical protein
MRSLPIGTLGFTAVGVYLLVPASSVAETDRTYPLSMQEAAARLAMASPPDFVFGTYGADVSREEAPGRIVWHVSVQNRQILRYVLTLEASGEAATRVRLSIEDAERNFQPTGKDDKVDRPSIRAMYLTAMDEEVSASLERRSYNMSRIYLATMRAAFANMAGLNAQFDHAAAASHKREAAGRE